MCPWLTSHSEHPSTPSGCGARSCWANANSEIVPRVVWLRRRFEPKGDSTQSRKFRVRQSHNRAATVSLYLLGLPRTGRTLSDGHKEPARNANLLTAGVTAKPEKGSTGLGTLLGSASGHRSIRPLSLAAANSQQAKLRTSLQRIDDRSRFLLVQSNARRPKIEFGIQQLSSGVSLLV